MMFDSEPEAFEAYANAMPNNCVFLVDTYDTLEGVQNAIKVGRRMREQGHEMVGIRLDSGDLTSLSIAARRLLDDSEFPHVKIVASDSLNEHRIARLKAEGAKIDIWGVGTNLVTAQDQPALGGVYKLSAQRDATRNQWVPKIKRSNSPIKVSNPGRLQIYHICSNGIWHGDVLGEEPPAQNALVYSLSGELTSLPKNCTPTPMLQPKMVSKKFHRLKPYTIFVEGLS